MYPNRRLFLYSTFLSNFQFSASLILLGETGWSKCVTTINFLITISWVPILSQNLYLRSYCLTVFFFDIMNTGYPLRMDEMMAWFWVVLYKAGKEGVSRSKCNGEWCSEEVHINGCSMVWEVLQRRTTLYYKGIISAWIVQQCILGLIFKGTFVDICD